MARNIADLVEHAVDAFPERLAVVCGDEERTYAALEERANRLAHHLAAHGVGPGSHVGIYARNSMVVVETIVAIYKLRAVFININYRYVANELRYVLSDSECSALVHDRGLSGAVATALPHATAVKAVVVIEDGSAAEYASFAAVPFEEALAAGSPERDFGPRSADDIYMLYTGGTTGYPKGVVWRHEDVWRALGGGIDHVSGEVLADEWAQVERGRQMPLTRLCIAPLIHGSAQWSLLPSLFQGETVVLLPRFDPRAMWREIERRKVNVVVLVGDAMARPFIEEYLAGDYDGSSILSISTNAAVFSPSVTEQIVTAFPHALLSEAVGSSEMGFVGIGFKTPGAGSDGPRICAGPHTIIIDQDGKRAAPGVAGRLGRGVHIPQGYYKDPATTAALFQEVDGLRYAFSGDWARYEEDGTITLLGRGNTSINTGGEKVYPEEVEGALKSHPDIFDALVLGVPDERLGQRVAAIVQPRHGCTLDLPSLELHLRTLIAGYKVPRSVWLVDQVGRTVSGKQDYRWARTYVQDHPPAVAA
ncbi:MAG TPA: acyl-CoA synthetase [Micromonosporaceae bacterium]|jgi:acyl-CoA synthetase (AMP-forming)/AMP-acid ligase II